MISDYRLHKKLSELSPLTDQQMHEIWIDAPYPETSKLLWGIRRLHKDIEGLHRSAVALTAGRPQYEADHRHPSADFRLPDTGLEQLHPPASGNKPLAVYDSPPDE